MYGFDVICILYFSIYYRFDTFDYLQAMDI